MKTKISKKTKAGLAAADAEIAQIMNGNIPKGVKVFYALKPLSPEWIKDLRKRMKLSQTDLSACVHASVSAVRHWEQGIRRPSGSAGVILRLMSLQPKLISTLKGM
jgi:DNA-binding transcriptional regulator YiaG